MSNPMLGELPEEVVRQLGPLLPLAWWMAGAHVRDHLRHCGGAGGPGMPGPASPFGLRDEVAAVAAVAAAPRTTTTIRLDCAQPSPSSLQMLAERMSLREDLWSAIGPWQQVTSYRYSAGAGMDRVWCIVRPGMLRLEISHRLELERTRVRCEAGAAGAGEAAAAGVPGTTRPRNPWSRREDAANLVSDLWVQAQLGCLEVPAACRRLSERAAQLGVTSSELWEHHRALGERVGMRAAFGSGCASAPAATPAGGFAAAGGDRSGGQVAALGAEVLVDAPLHEDQLPKIVLPDLVVHAMEKVLVTHGGVRLVLRVAATGPSYQEAERRLWAVLRGGAQGAAECCVVLEYEAVAMQIPRFFLTRATDAVRLMISLGLLDVPASCVRLGCAESDLASAQRIWSSAFLARPLAHVDPQEAAVLAERMQEALEQSPWRAETPAEASGKPRAAAHWGMLWEPKVQPDADLRECPTSGSMPRLYRPPASARHFVVRPKLFFLAGVSGGSA
jgi:hypothetical protein